MMVEQPEADYFLDDRVVFLQRFMNTFNLDRAVLIGNSMGGAIALKFALQFRQRVSKLVLISSLGLGREIDWSKKILAVFPFLINYSKPSRQGAKAVMNSCVYDARSVPSNWIDMSCQYFKVPNKKRMMKSLIKTNFDLWGQKDEVFKPIISQLQNITAPTLIIWGKQDRVIPVKHAAVAAQIPHSTVHIFDRCGHWAQVEYPEEFNRITLDFLQRD